MGLRRNNNLMLPILTSLLTLNIFKRVKRQRCVAIDSIFNIANDVPQRFCVLMNHGKALVLMFYIAVKYRWLSPAFCFRNTFSWCFQGVKLTRRPTHIDTLLYTFHFRVLTLQVIIL